MREKAFGQLMKDARRGRGWRQKQWAKMLGISTTYCSIVERGGQVMSLKLFTRWWQLLDFDANAALRTLSVTVETPKKRRTRESVMMSPNAKAGEYVAFGRLLASARRRAEVTQQELARVLQCKYLHVSRIETGRRLPSVRCLAQMHRILDVDANQLLAHLCDPSLTVAFYGFGRVVELARIALSMSSDEVAVGADCDLERYRAIESGAVLPSIEELVRIHRVTRLDANAALRWLWQNGAQSDGADKAD